VIVIFNFILVKKMPSDSCNMRANNAKKSKRKKPINGVALFIFEEFFF
jgi:hypothetical protein